MTACRRRLTVDMSLDQAAAPCARCGHTMLVHGGPLSPAIDECALCTVVGRTVPGRLDALGAEPYALAHELCYRYHDGSTELTGFATADGFLVSCAECKAHARDVLAVIRAALTEAAMTERPMPHAHCPDCLGAIGTHRTTCPRHPSNVGGVTDQTIAAFLRARLDEDEAVIDRAGPDRDADLPYDSALYVVDDDYRHDQVGIWPSRARREIAAKRRIVEIHAPDHLEPDICSTCASHAEAYPCRTLRALAGVYADHPDYRPEWAIP